MAANAIFSAIGVNFGVICGVISCALVSIDY